MIQNQDVWLIDHYIRLHYLFWRGKKANLLSFHKWGKVETNIPVSHSPVTEGEKADCSTFHSMFYPKAFIDLVLKLDIKQQDLFQKLYVVWSNKSNTELVQRRAQEQTPSNQSPGGNLQNSIDVDTLIWVNSIYVCESFFIGHIVMWCEKWDLPVSMAGLYKPEDDWLM